MSSIFSIKLLYFDEQPDIVHNLRVDRDETKELNHALVNCNNTEGKLRHNKPFSHICRGHNKSKHHITVIYKLYKFMLADK